MENKHPLVTILLPVYNGEKTIKTTLESLINQTYNDFEIIIGIDGTTDKSKDIALAFNDYRIKIIEHPKNLGLANNLNKIVKYSSAQSKYIAMAEQDDIYVRDRLQLQVEFLENNSDFNLVSGIAKFISDKNTVLFPGILVNSKQFPQGIEMFKYLFVNQLKVVNTCMMFRKSTHINNHYCFNDTYNNFNVDWDYILRFSLENKIYGLNKVLVRMNRKSNNISITSSKWKQFEASRNLLKDYKHEFPQIITKKDYEAALKQHRKIELGYRSKLGIIFFSFVYFLIYKDFYFLKYLYFRTRKFLSNL